MTKKEDEEIVVPMAVEPIASAEPAGYAETPSKTEADSGPPVPEGHTRYYCNKCRTPYDLPKGATSWRCANCHEFNSTTMGECEWCSVL